MITLALKAAKRSVGLSGEKNPSHLDTLAMAPYLSGHPAAAVASAAKASGLGGAIAGLFIASEHQLITLPSSRPQARTCVLRA